LKLPKGARILDLCRGHGRHLLSLVKAGYEMTGLDLSQKALNLLKVNAKKQKLNVRIIRGDMRRIPFENEFDAVINMFTAFGYLENDQEDLKVLKSVNQALKPGGKFLIDVLSKDWVLANFQSKSWRKAGKFILLEEAIHNSKNTINITKNIIIDSKGRRHEFIIELLLYSLKELRRVLKKVGLKVVKTYSNTLNGKAYTKASKRLVVLAKKK